MHRHCFAVAIFSFSFLFVFGCGKTESPVANKTESTSANSAPATVRSDAKPHRGRPPVEARTNRAVNRTATTNDDRGSESSEPLDSSNDQAGTTAADGSATKPVGSNSKDDAATSSLAKSEADSEHSDSAAPAKVPEMAEASGKDGIKAGDTIIEIKGKDIDGESFALSDYAGKVVLLDFWGDW